MISFRTYLREAFEAQQGNLSAGTVNSINKELFKLTQGDDKSVDFAQMFSDISGVLASFNVTMVNETGEQFKPEVVINKMETFVNLANDTGNINNVVLDVKWNKFQDEYALKECSLQEKK